MIQLINVHCHLLNFDFISPTCFKSRSASLEWMLRHKHSRPLVRVVAAAMPRRKLHRLHEIYDLMRMDIRDVAKRLRQEMMMSGIQLATPLIMDLGRTAFTENPQVPFNFQVKLISDISLDHLGVIMPFVMVDPRRSRATDLLARCLTELGFLGFKMYPALGYHPDPASIYNDPQTNDELKKIYDYCEHERIPITVHCSPGGAYSNDILRQKAVRAEVTQPSSWVGVLKKYPKLQLNLGHFGQDLTDINNPNTWSYQIRELIRAYPGVYTDLAYNKAGLEERTSKAYFASLVQILDDDPVLCNRVLFGTDWSMPRHTWTEMEYVRPFRQLGEGRLRRIAFENSLDFLFPERKYPERLANFLTANGKRVSELPQHLIANLKFSQARGW